MLAYVLARKGAESEAREILRKLESMGAEESYVSPFHLATVYVALGQTEQARFWLEQVRNRHDPRYIWLHTDPRLDPLWKNTQV